MRDLPIAAQRYVTAVMVLAAAAAVASVIGAPIRWQMAPVGGLLLLGACVAQVFKVRTPKHQSYYTTTIFFVAAALLLRPGYVVAVVAITHLMELARVRYRWYIQAFNIATFTLCGLAAGWIFQAGLPTAIPAGLSIALRGAAAGLTFVLLNHVLTGLVILWARGIPLARAGTLSLDNLGTDLALAAIGVVVAMLWLSNPWLTPLCLGPLFLTYRSLLVPTLQEEARTDPKTELFNLKHWNEVAAAEIERAGRFRRPLSVVLADLDLLRDINNHHGHMVGDQLIRRAAEVIRQALRDYDVAARFGGDEFVILMPETTGDEAASVAERIRQALAAVELRVGATSVGATMSIGVARFPKDGRTPATLLEAADRAVYRSKAEGRNRVSVFAA
jgi:diguanylate cyclase (GGDEF)-like protein